MTRHTSLFFPWKVHLLKWQLISNDISKQMVETVLCSKEFVNQLSLSLLLKYFKPVSCLHFMVPVTNITYPWSISTSRLQMCTSLSSQFLNILIFMTISNETKYFSVVSWSDKIDPICHIPPCYNNKSIKSMLEKKKKICWFLELGMLEAICHLLAHFQVFEKFIY